MWSSNQRERLALEHALLQQEGFSQFGVYWYRATDTYEASGVASASSGRQYSLAIPIPAGFPNQRPPMYVTDPLPLRMADGSLLSALGVSHQMHTASSILKWNDSDLPLARRALALKHPTS